MTARLRTIRTTFRSASVKRSEVRSAAKAAIVNRESRTQVYRDRKSGKQASAGFRK